METAIPFDATRYIFYINAIIYCYTIMQNRFNFSESPELNGFEWILTGRLHCTSSLGTHLYSLVKSDLSCEGIYELDGNLLKVKDVESLAGPSGRLACVLLKKDVTDQSISAPSYAVSLVEE